jgi:hypothetical protein
MSKINKQELAALYSGADIHMVWQNSQHLAVIDHPKFGKISPNQYRAMSAGKPCPFCAQKMTHGASAQTKSKKEAIARCYQYKDAKGKDRINRAGDSYFHPHYVTLDHKLNKARCPEQMFDYENLQLMCWRCNNAKGDNNAYELEHSYSYIQGLAEEVLNRYPTL